MYLAGMIMHETPTGRNNSTKSIDVSLLLNILRMFGNKTNVMTIKKITPGFVIQTWNVETQKWTHQEFIAGDEYTYEDEHGNLATVDDMVPPSYAEPYLNFGMIQPEL